MDGPAGSPFLDGAYRIVGRLGSGLLTHVLLGEEVASGRKVVVKLGRRREGDGSGEAIVRHEATLLGRLRGPYWPALLGSGEIDGEAYLIREYLEGTTLDERVAAGPLPWSEVRGILGDLAAALGTLHVLGWVHCDVKPGNFLQGPPGTPVRLIDVNVARPLSSTTGGQFVGTAGYMAPEQWRGDPLSPATDVYALAALAMTLLAGAPLFATHGRLGWLRAHLEERPRSLGERGIAVPPAVEAGLAAALAKQPLDRPPSPGALVARLGP